MMAFVKSTVSHGCTTCRCPSSRLSPRSTPRSREASPQNSLE